MKANETDGRVARSLSGEGKTPKIYFRASEADQQTMRDAAELRGESFSEFARRVLLGAARRALKTGKRKR